ncbi:hypothetical protein [Pseudomonas sp. LP_7_YM]|uniref:hypothetical protein n=1 Tax=Pseudomonas sp. LP_7_YM TaxID=2485137 RepID=UPI00105BBCDB|nr:hypothetical protein [Pseudomonas sp. LP_7_YM]TDV63436.1 hypothetical protein EC915_106203 [Pseudomonas sp. LP_7_YM]
MNIFKHAAQVCRRASGSPLTPSDAASRIQPAIAAALDRTLETIARVLCVQRHGVMICGTSAASVAHFSNPHFVDHPASPKP